MADPNLNLHQNVSPKALQRTVLLGRVKMAQAIRLSEPEWAKLIAEIERDPLFRDLMHARVGEQSIVRYKRLPRSRMSGQFYDAQDSQVAGGAGEMPEALLDKRRDVMAVIQTIGQEKFEKHFLYREGGESHEEIASLCGIAVDDAKKVEDFILEMSVNAEFFHPSALTGNGAVRPTVMGRIIRNADGTYIMAFFSPHLARGQYEINQAALKLWQRDKKLNRIDAARIRKFVGVLEMSNLKQGAFWRTLDYLMVLQKDYFDSQNDARMAPVSLRKVAKFLQFAPSTISRVIGNKSVLLPWDREVLILDLMPGQRRVVLSILDRMMADGVANMTDARLAKHIAEKFGVRVSRRTITACRHALANRHRRAA